LVTKILKAFRILNLFNTLGHHLTHDTSSICYLGDVKEFMQAFRTNSKSKMFAISHEVQHAKGQNTFIFS